MKYLRLVRVTEHNGATLGVLTIDGMAEMLTLEDPWHLNERNISCIPEGRYKIKPNNSPKFGKTYIVDDVPERSHILIHSGNTPKDTHGCILVGLQYGELNDMPAVLASRSAFGKFMELMAGDEGELVIINAYGGGRVH
jgi:hypothetical protein